MPTSRDDRIAERRRDPRWRPVPLRIEVLDCIDCDVCIGHCPPEFGAIFRHAIDVIIVPELCSGCGKCIPPCPVDCIHPDPEWHARVTPASWWRLPNGDEDPYRHRATRGPVRERDVDGR